MRSSGQLRRLQRRLAAVPKNVKREVGPALIEVAETMAEDMRRLVPVQFGDLRDSITVTGPGEQTPMYSQPGGKTTVPENAVMITAGHGDVRYAHLVEYGTRSHTISANPDAKPHPGAVAHPFFWPSYRLNRKKGLSKIRSSVRKAVKKNV